MTGGSWALLGVAGAFAVGNWVSRATDNRPLEYVTKPAAMVALIGVALILDPVDSAARGWFVAALILSLAGDVFLMLPNEQFVAGLGSFLLAHVAYVAGLVASGLEAGLLVAGIVVVLVAMAALGRRIVGAVRGGSDPGLAAPVTAYMTVISAMVGSAIGTGSAIAITGAVSFYASDSLIAWTRFVHPYRWGPVAIMVTYHVGQALLVLSLV